MNEFYSIAEENQEPVNSWQLTNLGKQRVFAMFGTFGRGDWGQRDHRTDTIYTSTTAEDYDRHFAHKLGTTKPPYDVPMLLDFHLNYYLNTSNGGRDKFIKQMKYVILPILKKQSGKEVYIDLLNEWIDEKEANTKNKTTTIVNHINTGDINAPTQFQQGSDHSKQTQQVAYTKENILELFSLLKADMEKLSKETKEELQSEIDYALKQLNKEKDIRQQLLNIGSIIKNTGWSLFINLASSGIFEVMKPALGLG